MPIKRAYREPKSDKVFGQQRKGPDQRVDRLRRKIFRLQRRRRLYMLGLMVLLIWSAVEVVVVALGHGMTGELSPAEGNRLAICCFLFIWFGYGAYGIPYKIRWYEQRITNLLSSSGNLERLAKIIERRERFALLLRSFEIESQHTEVVITDPQTGSGALVDYQVLTDIYTTLMPALQDSLPVFTLLNEWDYSPSWVVQRVDVGDEWEIYFERCAREATILVAFVLRKVSHFLKEEIKWIDANDAGNRTIIITSQSLEYKVNKILPRGASVVVIPPLDHFRLDDVLSNRELLASSAALLAKLVSRYSGSGASPKSPSK